MLYLPFPPTANNLFPTGKSGKRFPSKQYQRWRANAAAALEHQASRLTPGKVQVEYAFARPDKRRRDVENLAKACSDFLVTHGLIEDDSLIQRSVQEWHEAKQFNGVRVTITPWT